MKIDYIRSQLLLRGIDSYSSWMGKTDGAYMVCRPYNSKSNDALVALIPIDDNEDDKFVEFIESKLKTITPKAP